jgi:predicted nucleic acid-binding protein
MTIKVALDTNVLLDLLLEGRPHKAAAEWILSAAESGRFMLQITTQSIIDAAYTTRKQKMDAKTFVESIDRLRSFVQITAVDWIDLSWSVSNTQYGSSGDFEDDAQIANAYNSLCDYFITRDKKLLNLNREDCPLMIISPGSFIAEMAVRK